MNETTGKVIRIFCTAALFSYGITQSSLPEMKIFVLLQSFSMGVGFGISREKYGFFPTYVAHSTRSIIMVSIYQTKLLSSPIPTLLSFLPIYLIMKSALDSKTENSLK